MYALTGWWIDSYYQPAREVGGDFYGFIDLPDGRLGLVIGDVTDKGVPIALVMATTRSILRAVGRLEPPGAVLGRINDVLVDEIPPSDLPVRHPRPEERSAALRQRRPRPTLPLCRSCLI